jgi:nitrite reductase/ring-hydroxylating ferredoxin subunit/uncharacterized membrane protein
MPALDELIQRIEQVDALDAGAEAVASAVSRVTHRPPVSNVVGGSWLGHPVHPALTDLPIGFWTSALVLDLCAGRSGRRAAQSLVGLGVLSAVPTALTGLADWSDTSGRTRRVGIAHALLNSAGLVSFTLSWRARRHGHHARGLLFTMVGSAAATLAASLGGHLVYRTGTGVDVNAFNPGPTDWAPLDGDLEPVTGLDGGYATAAGEPLLVSRTTHGWNAIGARCSHRGGPLQQGTVADGCVTCPWHQSRFRLDDGAVVDGPAAAPQPTYAVSEVDGRLSVASAPDVRSDLPAL